MGNREQTVLLVSNDAGVCAAARRRFDSKSAGVRVAAVSSVAAARRILEEDSPTVILLEQDSLAAETAGAGEMAPTLETAVASLAIYAPVVVIGPPEKRAEISALIDAGAGSPGCHSSSVRKRWMRSTNCTGSQPRA